MYEALLNLGMFGPILLILIGMAILVGGGESLVRGATRLAAAMKIPPLIVGLTVVAFCTSAPEFAVSLSATFKGNADIAVGNVVGSNICNICLILGFSALLRPILVSASLIRREIPLMIGLSVLLYVFAVTGAVEPVSNLFRRTLEGKILPWHGGVFVALLFAYVGWTVHEVRAKKSRNEEYVKEIEEETPTIGGSLSGIVLLLIGIGLLVVGSDMMVQGAVKVAQKLGVSELVIGLTIVAVGTSLPELVVSVLAAVQGKSDIAVGNVVGSNIFNILGVLGPCALFSFATPSRAVNVSAPSLWLDMPVMILTAVFCSVICITGHRVTRGEGLFLLACYAIYLGFLCFLQTN